MNRGTAIATIAYRLGNRTDLNTKILSEMDLIQSTLLEQPGALVGDFPWFLLSEMSSSETNVGDERLEVPSNMLAEYDQGTLWLYDSTLDDPWVELIKDDYDFLKAQNLGSGKPTHYALVGKYFRLAPIPDAIYPAKMLFWKSDTLPSALANDSATNLWLTHAPDLLIAETAQVMALGHLQNMQLAMAFGAQAKQARDRLANQTATRKFANRRLVMGGGN